MNVWLWDAGRWCGVSENPASAIAAASVCLLDGEVGTARVELARLSHSPRLEPAYERTGSGWTALLDDGLPRWTPLGDLIALNSETVLCSF